MCWTCQPSTGQADSASLPVLQDRLSGFWLLYDGSLLVLTVTAGCLLVGFAIVGQRIGDIDPGKSYAIYDDLSADAHILLAAKAQPAVSNGTWAAAPGDPGRWSLPDNDTGKSLDLLQPPLGTLAGGPWVCRSRSRGPWQVVPARQ